MTSHSPLPLPPDGRAIVPSRRECGSNAATVPLALAALGIVFGDIGTSPLYALKECVSGPHGVPPTPENILGVLSLIFWSLTMVVTVKYLTFVTRVDNRGEGGIFALLALSPARCDKPRARVGLLTVLALIGAALLYGDGVITPAISVLSAVEGLEIATVTLKPVVVPLTCAILLGLFTVQKWGTTRVGRVFGPVMVLWFGVLGALGVAFILKNPSVLRAINPLHAITFFGAHGLHGLTVLGSVVLVVTGGEALYADMGHFGRGPIRAAWYGLVMPALLLNYFGQGALLLQHPEAASSPFYAMVPRGIPTYALAGLATAATVIASQALISGAFSLTHQAVQLGFLPRVNVKHTSRDTEGQIYIPQVNWALAIGCIALVLIFKSSGRLAAAYGLAVTGTMAITSILYFVVQRARGSSLWAAIPLLLLFLTFDLAFFGANVLKFHDGGYVPVLIALVLFALMAIWKKGTTILAERFPRSGTVEEHLQALRSVNGSRVPGTGVFLASSELEMPAVLMHHILNNKALHERVILLSVVTEHVPRVKEDQRFELTDLGHGFSRLVVRSGFMQRTNVPHILRKAAEKSPEALPIDPSDVTYFLGRETFLATSKGKMGRLPETLFAFMARNAAGGEDYLYLPHSRVVEIGVRVDL